MELKDLFGRKKSKKYADGIERVEVNRTEVEKVDIPKTSPLTMTFRNTKTERSVQQNLETMKVSTNVWGIKTCN